jgi:hypothetical protein
MRRPFIQQQLNLHEQINMRVSSLPGRMTSGFIKPTFLPIKKLFFLILAISFLGLFSGCELDDDEYSLGNFWVEFGMVNKDASESLFTITLDDGEVLYPTVNPCLVDDVFNNERVLVNFTILGNKQNPEHKEQYYVKINSLRKILYKGIFEITPEKEDSIGNDPIRVDDHWIKNDVLNFKLKFYGGSKTHYLNLVRQPGAIDVTNGPVLLELRHNDNDDSAGLPFVDFVSFDLSSLKIPGRTSTPFKITAKGYNGATYEYTGEYKY